MIQMLTKSSDTKEITGYTLWLVMRGQIAGNFCCDGHSSSKEERNIITSCRSICDFISKKLTTCKAKDIVELIDCYEMTHRLGYGNMPTPSFVETHRKRLFNEWQQGGSDIKESSVFYMLSPQRFIYCDPKYKNKYAQALRLLRNKWLGTLIRDSYFPDVTTYENYQRLALIMRDNINDHFKCNSKQVMNIKRRWYEYNKVDDPSTLSTQILCSYRRFASSLFPDVLDYSTQMELDNSILSELTTRSDLAPYDREAFRLALEFNKKQVIS